MRALQTAPTAVARPVDSYEAVEDHPWEALMAHSLAALFFGPLFPASELEPSSARAALCKTSFVYRHFLWPGGLKLQVDGERVRLQGEVASELLVLLARNLVRNVPGLTQVVDDTKRERGKAETSESRGIDQRSRVQWMIATDALLAAQEIEVHSAGDSVTVAGKVASERHRHWAFRLLKDLRGVPDVHFDLVVTDSVSPRRTDWRLDDESLAAIVATRLALSASDEAKGMSAEARRRVITLQGTAPEAERDFAIDIARQTCGTAKVHHQNGPAAKRRKTK